MYDLIVLGAGPGGYEAALYAGRMGKSVLLIEATYIGGTCLNVGCVPTKTFLHAAKVYEEALHGKETGVNTGKVEFDMAAVLQRKEEIVGKLTGGIEVMLKAAKVKVVRGRGVVKSRGVVEVDGKNYEGENILISTGSRPAKPPIPGIDSEGVINSTGALKLDKLPKKLAVIGGGVIGVEFASFFASVGCEVTVVEMLDRICPFLDSEVAKYLMNALKKQGINFELSAKVEKIEKGAVHFSTKKGAQKIEADKVLVATGRSLNLKNNGFEEVGIDFDRGGIKVDSRGRTNVAGIWACGDVTGRCLLAHSATREGQVAVNDMFGNIDFMSYKAMPSVVYTHPESSGIGLTEDVAKEKGIEVKCFKKPMQAVGRYLIEHGNQPGVCKVVAGAQYGEILGVHLVGGPASEMIWGAAPLIEQEVTLEELRKTVFPHPTISEIIKECVMH